MNRSAFGLAAVLTACLGMSSMAHAAAALANGAATSAKATAKDAAKKQIQIAADPIGIIDFQFTLHYDPVILHVAVDDNEQPLIRGINGYDLGVRGNPTAPKYSINEARGYVTVRGFWPAPDGQAVPDYEIDVYDVVFELNDTWDSGIPIPDDTEFIIYSLGITSRTNGLGQNDFMNAGEVTGPNEVRVTRTYTAGDPQNPILQNDTGLISIGGEGSGIPEPAAISAVFPAAFLLRRRRR